MTDREMLELVATILESGKEIEPGSRLHLGLRAHLTGEADILDTARKYTQPVSAEEQCFYADGTPSREMHVIEKWTFCTEELVAFARELLEKSP